MKTIKRIFFVILSLTIIFTIYLIQDFNKYESNVSNKKHFDLYIADRFLRKSDHFSLYQFLHVHDSTTVWSDVKKSQRRPMKWDIKGLETLNYISISLKNISGEKMYYMSWGTPFSRTREHFILYKNGIKTLIPFGGFDCGTGIYLEKMDVNETITNKNYSPLLFNPYTNAPLPLHSEKFPKLFKEIYGDSIKVILQQATYGSPWNKYPSQMITSQAFSVSTKKIIENWKRGNFSKNPMFMEERESAFYTPDEDEKN